MSSLPAVFVSGTVLGAVLLSTGLLLTKLNSNFSPVFSATICAPTSAKMQTFSVLHQKRSNPLRKPFCPTFLFPLRTIFSLG